MASPHDDVVRFDFKSAARALEEMVDSGPDSAVSGMRMIGEQIITDVKQNREGKGVPEDEGILRGTLRVVGPDAQGVVKLRAGGASAPYALVQHERLDYHHNIGEARYLVRGVERFVRGQSGDPVAEMRKISQEIIRKAERAGRT